ncbi:BA14K family protein [Dichotomicrobium thermohalophilum]|uniref:Lectin-like protein BA14k n=1 Tax=Dichotomicrobium thermohalophilum TaxID=933063 RepID=A0A397PES3_9HYPH|nr:BA14K family protein [Dichotomicrobium thermohalophilum]RIA47458.1 BA14K-like protein [Dichotomicrobium thermohalophilum]
MMKSVSSVCAGLMVAAGLAGAASAAQVEAPVSNLPAGITSQADGVRVADAGDFGAGVAVGVIGSLIAQGIAEERAREIRNEEWRWRKCDREFRSFEWDTGMYTTYSGHRRVCPYLR